MIPTTLYLHLPWCVQKCPYCDFNSHAGQPSEMAYITALEKDLLFELAHYPAPRIEAIFIGGGTPSLFSGAGIQAILNMLSKHLRLKPGLEITMEANPGTADATNFQAYRASGVNRLSIGVQSFSDALLPALGRIHNSDEARKAFAMAREAGFDNINVDLMHGLPGQNLAQAEHDLSSAIALGPEHISWYQLTIEANTAFGQNPPTLPDDDNCADIEDLGLAMLRAAGYQRYEISAYCRTGRRSQHNLNYWRFGDYLGLGAGAHGKRTLPDGRVRRLARLRSPQRYMQHAGSEEAIARDHSPSQEELISEFALNTLRVSGAFTRHRFEQRTGLNAELLRTALAEAESLGLAHWDTERLRTTKLGRQHLNRLLECFA